MTIVWWTVIAAMLLSGLVGLVNPQKIGFKNRKEAFGGVVVSALILAVSVVLLDPFGEADAVAAKREEAAKDPITYAAYLIGEGHSVKAERHNDGSLVVSYQLDPYSVSSAKQIRETYLIQAKELFTELYTRFPGLHAVDLNGVGTLVSLRGQENSAEVAKMRFTKDNAATIKWENVPKENLPLVADKSWFHPALKMP